MMSKYKLLTGMQDFLPEDTKNWQYIENIFYEWVDSYAYESIRTPILEAKQLFVRSVGETTDVIGKEMYTFQDISSEEIALRPEGTVSTLRAVIEHNYLYSGPKKLWYYGPMFRRERPQKGRYRQFHQFGVEALGFSGVDIDAEIILMSFDLWKRLGLESNVQLEINTLGNGEERRNYRQYLVKYLEKHKHLLDEDSLRRLDSNPLRILDTKNPELQEICNQAPRLVDFIGEESKLFYDSLKMILTELEIPFHENHRLVRGLDYYNHTVFEWTTKQLGSQGTVCAGGRYNGLIQELGGSDVSGIGFAIGMERIILLMRTLGCFDFKNEIDFYVVSQNEKCLIKAMKYATILRSHHYSVYTYLGEQKIGTQFKKANSSGARYAMVIGESELEHNTITFKDLRSGKGQRTIESENMICFLQEWVK
ncbi:MAG: histidine--tRNA ligase [Neisseriaceae bacterium]|nr:MAG: histidine--tRNA ligase [Neisseriaceae bacterium]